MRYTVLGTFSKGKPGSIAINFAPSAGANCSKACSHFQDGTCYAVNVEGYKPSITVNLERKAADLPGYLDALLAPRAQEKLSKAPWIRISAFGSLPPLGRLTAPLRARMRDLGTMLAPHLDKIHVPVETLRKAIAYRQLGWSPRVSLGKTTDPNWRRRWRRARAHRFPTAVTCDVADREPGWTHRAKEQARELQRRLTRQYPDLVVKTCPAIVGSAKCGNCRLCAQSGADLVIYPEHP